MYTRRRFGWTFGGGGRGGGGGGGVRRGSSPVLLTENGPRRVLTRPQMFPKETKESYTYKFENRSRTSCSDSSNHSLSLMKLLSSSDLRKLRTEPAVRWFGLSFAPFSKHNERFERQYRHEPPPEFSLTLPPRHANTCIVVVVTYGLSVPLPRL